MKISDLFETITAEGKKDRTPNGDQFDFDIDRKGKRIVGEQFDWKDLLGLSQRETIRVQTNRSFEWSCKTPVPDTSSGELRNVPCEIVLHGAIEQNEHVARGYVLAALEMDFGFEGWLKSKFEELLNAASTQRGGAIVRALRGRDERARLENQLLQTIRRHIPVSTIRLHTVIHDNTSHVDLEELHENLEVRFKSRLEVNRVGYKARLVWGSGDNDVIGRLTAFDGRNIRSINELRAHEKQIFRSALVDALANESWSDVIGASDTVIARVKQRISAQLGPATGRVVDDLVVIGVGGHEQPESSFSCLWRYAIRGLRNEELEVEHGIRYQLVERDRWMVQKSPEAKEFLSVRVREATRLCVSEMTFEDIIKLYLQGADGEHVLGRRIAERVRPQAEAVGFRLVSVITILQIPAMGFVQGRSIEVTERHYRFADKNLEVPLLIRARVQVASGADKAQRFTRAVVQGEDFESRVCMRLAEVVGLTLRKLPVLDYYQSSYVNGAPVFRAELDRGPASYALGGRLLEDFVPGCSDKTGDSELRTFEKSACTVGTVAGKDSEDQLGHFEQTIRSAAASELLQQFGLELTDFDLQAGADKLIQRIGDLVCLPLDFPIDMSFSAWHPDAEVRIKGQASLFVQGLNAGTWESFYHNALRFDMNQHIADIRSKLERALQAILIGLAASTTIERRNEVRIEKLLQVIGKTIRDECGLVVKVDLPALAVLRPEGAELEALNIKLEALKDAYRLTLNKRLEQSTRGPATYEDAEDIQTLNTRADQLLEEIKSSGTKLDEARARRELIGITRSSEGDRPLLGS